MDRLKLSSSNMTLKVTPEQLITQADEVLKDVNLIQKCIDTIEEKVEGTKGYWLGEAGELHRKLYNDQKQAIDTMMRRLNEHPRDLKMIASTYISAEKETVAIANALTDNVII